MYLLSAFIFGALLVTNHSVDINTMHIMVFVWSHHNVVINYNLEYVTKRIICNKLSQKYCKSEYTLPYLIVCCILLVSVLFHIFEQPYIIITFIENVF